MKRKGMDKNCCPQRFHHVNLQNKSVIQNLVSILMYKNLFIITSLFCTAAHAEQVFHFLTTIRDVSSVKAFTQFSKSIMIRVPDDGISGSDLMDEFLQVAITDTKIPKNAKVIKLTQSGTAINPETHYSTEDIAQGGLFILSIEVASASETAASMLQGAEHKANTREVLVTVKEQRKPIMLPLKIESQVSGSRIIQDAIEKTDKTILGKKYDVYYFTAENFKYPVEHSKFYNTADINRLEIHIKS